jgi:membrane associated rhomboid family serine protease
MKPFTTIAVVVFSLVALVQLLRVVLGWEVTVNGFAIPFWASVIACMVAATLAYMLRRAAECRPARRSNRHEQMCNR